MKKILSVIVVVFSSTAFADKYVCDIDHMLSMEQIQQKLIMQGYKTVRELQLDDCIYEANVIDRNNDRWDVQINPKNGNVIGKERDNLMD